jgi:hypothetical protein
MSGARIRFLPKIRPAKKTDMKDKNLVWVQCDQYRCLAHMDAKGKWINFYTGKEVDGFVKVIG